MLRRIGVIVLWVLATVGTASITLAAVGQVGESTTEQAAVPVDGAELRASPAVQRLASTTTTTLSSTTTPLPDLTPSSIASDPASSSTTVVESGGSSTTSTSAATTTTVAQGQTVVRSLVGGTVTVYHQGSSVTLVSAVPASGGVWTVEVKQGGPEQVVVEFESESHESHYQASVEGGELQIDIEESPEHSED